MNEVPEPKEGVEEVSPSTVARRAVLKHGVKIAYVVPFVLSAVWATPAYAQGPSAGPPPPPPGPPVPRIRPIQLDAIPAELLALIEDVERHIVAA